MLMFTIICTYIFHSFLFVSSLIIPPLPLLADITLILSLGKLMFISLFNNITTIAPTLITLFITSSSFESDSELHSSFVLISDHLSNTLLQSHYFKFCSIINFNNIKFYY